MPSCYLSLTAFVMAVALVLLLVAIWMDAVGTDAVLPLRARASFLFSESFLSILFHFPCS